MTLLLACPFSAASTHTSIFTGKERDAESGNDYFGARYFNSTMGRFVSPDWSAEVEPVPYAKLGDPQSLNLYTYVGNNPLVGIDPDGHCNTLLNPNCYLQPAPTQNYCADGYNCSDIGIDNSDHSNAAAQQQNGSSKGPGFWGRVGQRLNNFFHGNGLITNAELDGIVGAGTMGRILSVEEVKPEPNPYVSLGLDALGTAATLTGRDGLAKGAAIGSGFYDPSPMNLLLNGGSLVPGTLGEAFGPITVVYDAGGLAGGVVTNNIMAPMINAIPGNTMGNGNGISIPTPEATCVANGFC
jgi:RHS repeat-associated protein